jgi:hypothetical protein
LLLVLSRHTLIQVPTSLDEPLPLCEATLTDLSGEHRPSDATGTRRFRN